MTKMLNVLERFLNHHGYLYLRLDGTTRVEQRQVSLYQQHLFSRFKPGSYTSLEWGISPADIGELMPQKP